MPTAGQPSNAVPPKSAAIFTIAPSEPFLESVARGILAQVADDPLKLSDYTLLVPDRDTGNLLRQAFIEQLDGRPSIMPRIDAPGDVDNDYLSLVISHDPILSQTLMDIPPPVSRLERQLILAAEIMKIPGMSSSFQKAVKLGGELGVFIDDLQRNNIEIRDINALVPEAFRNQWEKTSEFLKIITDTWPAKLLEMGKVDPEDYKNVLNQIQAAHWMQYPPANRFLAVGFMDNSPATLTLLQAVSDLPQGAIVLPGVDLGLDADSWKKMTEVHPQYAFKSILEELKVTRQGVAAWPAPAVEQPHARAQNLPATNKERQKLLREAMRPAGTAEGWSSLQAAGAPKAAPKKTTGKKSAGSSAAKDADNDGIISKQALTGMDLIVCGTPQEEASVIALKLRETLEVPGRTGMLVTADRSLARRVVARLQYWKIDVDDGAGQSLSTTAAGTYLLATAQMAAEQWSPVKLLEALKHPLATLNETKSDFRAHLITLEETVLHGARPAPGAEGLRGALTDAFNRVSRRPDQAKTPEELAAEKAPIDDFINRLEASGKDFFDKASSGQKFPFLDLLDAHIRFTEALAADDKMKGAERLWRGDDGVKAARFFVNIRAAAGSMPPITGADYADVLQGLMQDVTVKHAAKPHSALKIVSPQQAMLTKADVVIAGGLNDESWPSAPKENPWLSPDMMKALGLPAPEESIGRAAQQFIQAVSSPNVLLTRAVRSGDAPSVVSPFLMRLQMVLKGAGLDDALQGKSHLLEIHTAIHTPAVVTPIEPPAPTPPLSARPKQLPVTAVEALMRDPYTVYAKYVLKLKKREPLDANPNVAEKGTFTHAALDAFVKKYPNKMPANAVEELLKIGDETFKTRLNNPSVQSFWWPRFERIAVWFVRFETERREMTRTLGTEVRGKLEIDLGDGSVFTLTTIADRVDRDAEDNMSIIDYKTGSVPAQKAVAKGFSPQLTLEALIAFTGGFNKIDAQDVGKLEYWKLSGGRPAAEVVDVKGNIKQLVSEAREGVEKLMRAFNDPSTPYLPTPRPEWAPRYQGYEHLARTGEWGTVKKVGAEKKARKPAPKPAKPATRRKGGAKS